MLQNYSIIYFTLTSFDYASNKLPLIINLMSSG